MVLHRADREVQGSRHLGVRVTVREEVRDLDLTGRESARYEQPIGRIGRLIRVGRDSGPPSVRAVMPPRGIACGLRLGSRALSEDRRCDELGSRIVAAFPAMMQRDRKREGLRVCRAAWLVGVSVREYRELEAGDRSPDSVTWERICKLYGWPV